MPRLFSENPPAGKVPSGICKMAKNGEMTEMFTGNADEI